MTTYYVDTSALVKRYVDAAILILIVLESV